MKYYMTTAGVKLTLEVGAWPILGEVYVDIVFTRNCSLNCLFCSRVCTSLHNRERTPSNICNIILAPKPSNKNVNNPTALRVSCVGSMGPTVRSVCFNCKPIPKSSSLITSSERKPTPTSNSQQSSIRVRALATARFPAKFTSTKSPN
jgi:hypothetical protein